MKLSQLQSYQYRKPRPTSALAHVTTEDCASTCRSSCVRLLMNKRCERARVRWYLVSAGEQQQLVVCHLEYSVTKVNKRWAQFAVHTHLQHTEGPCGQHCALNVRSFLQRRWHPTHSLLCACATTTAEQWDDGRVCVAQCQVEDMQCRCDAYIDRSLEVCAPGPRSTE